MYDQAAKRRRKALMDRRKPLIYLGLRPRVEMPGSRFPKWLRQGAL
jgi:hypothetical protein